MTKLVWVFLSILLGVLMGLGLTAFSVEHAPGFTLVKTGAWSARPRIGSMDADPYSKAFLATRGEIPMGAAEGLMISAAHDENGVALDNRCTYRLSGQFPSARFWTVSVQDARSAALATQNLRSSYTSSEALRHNGNQIEIMLSPDPQPGNWIPLPSDNTLLASHTFEIALRLYDAQVSANAYALDAASLPKITREGCP